MSIGEPLGGIGDLLSAPFIRIGEPPDNTLGAAPIEMDLSRRSKDSFTCQLSDGKLVTVVPNPFFPGFVDIIGKASSEKDTGAAAVAFGNALLKSGEPTVPKRGGIAGGGKSGSFTSPASKAFRSTFPGKLPVRVPTGGGRFTNSVGGALGRVVPRFGLLGIISGLISFASTLDVLRDAPECSPIA